MEALDAMKTEPLALEGAFSLIRDLSQDGYTTNLETRKEKIVPGDPRWNPELEADNEDDPTRHVRQEVLVCMLQVKGRRGGTLTGREITTVVALARDYGVACRTGGLAESGLVIE